MKINLPSNNAMGSAQTLHVFVLINSEILPQALLL